MGTLSGRGKHVPKRRYSRKFQRNAVERVETCEDVAELAKELGVTRRCLYKWRSKLEAVEVLDEASRPPTHAHHPIEKKSFSSSACSPRRRWRWIF
jgi:transposase-like protein